MSLFSDFSKIEMASAKLNSLAGSLMSIRVGKKQTKLFHSVWLLFPKFNGWLDVDEICIRFALFANEIGKSIDSGNDLNM